VSYRRGRARLPCHTSRKLNKEVNGSVRITGMQHKFFTTS